MTDKVQKIRKEVERIQLYTQSKVLKQVLDYIDKVQKEPVSEEFEKAAKDYSNNLDNIYGSIGEQTRNAFKAGAEWKLNQIRKENEKNRD